MCSKLEEVIEGLLGAARLFRIIRLAAHGRGGFTLPCRASGKVLAVVGHILRRHARADPDRAFEARARIEVHALNAGTQLDLTLRAFAARHNLRIDDGAAAGAARHLARAHHARIASTLRRDATGAGGSAGFALGFAAAALGARPLRTAVAIVVLVAALT